MMEPAPVSVVIPCYRCADTIARAVGSVLAQTLPPAEILLVEDCSNDDGRTLQALFALQRGDPRGTIKVIQLERNGGPAMARNRGWDDAAQPYVAFLDADDAWHPRKLEIQHGWMAGHADVDFSGHLIKVVSSISEIDQANGTPLARKLGRAGWLFSCRFSTISVMLRRELPFRFSADMRYTEDYQLWLNLALSGHDAWRIEMPLAFCFKPLYGSGGLTDSMWEMEKGEIAAYRDVYRKSLIPLVVFVPLVVYSLLKHMRRVVMASLRRG